MLQADGIYTINRTPFDAMYFNFATYQLLEQNLIQLIAQISIQLIANMLMRFIQRIIIQVIRNAIF